MTFDIDSFDEKQKNSLFTMVSDFDGPTSTGYVLSVLERALTECNPDWERDPQAISPDLRKELEVCMAALHYCKIRSLADM
ncbi:MAG TPA: hypothetical protein VFS63_16355 [Pseudolabrys sp.]|nr:hypothetical protein [Pseudolabrys sp.]